MPKTLKKILKISRMSSGPEYFHKKIFRKEMLIMIQSSFLLHIFFDFKLNSKGISKNIIDLCYDFFMETYKPEQVKRKRPENIHLFEFYYLS